MDTTQYNQIRATAVELERKINVLQNSYGVLSDADQQSLSAIEKDSQVLIAQLDALVRPETESAAHREGRLRDEQHENTTAARIASEHSKAPAPLPFQQPRRS